MNSFVYILRLSNNKYYIGQTSDLEQRIKQHLNGEEKSTKYYLPCKLAWYACFDSKTKAIKFENYLKTGSGFAFRKRHFI